MMSVLIGISDHMLSLLHFAMEKAKICITALVVINIKPDFSYRD